MPISSAYSFSQRSLVLARREPVAGVGTRHRVPLVADAARGRCTTTPGSSTTSPPLRLEDVRRQLGGLGVLHRRRGVLGPGVAAVAAPAAVEEAVGARRRRGRDRRPCSRRPSPCPDRGQDRRRARPGSAPGGLGRRLRRSRRRRRSGDHRRGAAAPSTGVKPAGGSRTAPATQPEPGWPPVTVNGIQPAGRAAVVHPPPASRRRSASPAAVVVSAQHRRRPAAQRGSAAIVSGRHRRRAGGPTAASARPAARRGRTGIGLADDADGAVHGALGGPQAPVRVDRPCPRACGSRRGRAGTEPSELPLSPIHPICWPAVTRAPATMPGSEPPRPVVGAVVGAGRVVVHVVHVVLASPRRRGWRRRSRRSGGR